MLPATPVQVQFVPAGDASRDTPLGKVSVIRIGLALKTVLTLAAITSVAWLVLKV